MKYFDIFWYGSVDLRTIQNQWKKFSISIFMLTAGIKACAQSSPELAMTLADRDLYEVQASRGVRGVWG